MACKYYYTQNGQPTTEGHDSVYEVLEYALGDSSVYSLYEEDPSLIFYDTSVTPQEEAEIKLKKAFSASYGKTGTSVSTIINDTVLAKYNEHKGVDDDSETTKKIRNFQKDFGTAIHECIAAKQKGEAAYKRACGDLNNLCKNEISKYTTEDKENLIFQSTIGNLLLGGNAFDSTAWIDAFVEPMWEKCELGTHNTMFEQPIYYKSPTGTDIVGRIDALFVTEDGTVHIFDFKTSASSRIKSVSAKQHYAQLYMYQQMLGQYGIPASKIKLHNAHISYGTGKVETTASAGINKAYIFNPADLENPVRTQANIRGMLKNHFPLQTIEITTEEARNLNQKARSAQQAFFSDKKLNRDTEENFTDYLKKIDENKPFKSALFDEAVTFKVDGENLTIHHIETKKDTTMSLSQFVKEELEQQKIKQYELIDGYRKAIDSHDIDEISALMSQRGNRNLHIAEQLGKYANPNWEVVGGTEGEYFADLGIIVVYNTADKCYDFISITHQVNFDSIYKLESDDEINMNILGNICEDRDLLKYRDATMPASVGNIYLMKTLMAVALGQKTLRTTDGNLNIGEIKVISSTTGHGTRIYDFSPYITQLRVAADIAKKNPGKIEHSELFQEIAAGCKSLNFQETIEILSQELSGLWFSLPMDFDMHGCSNLLNDFELAMAEANLNDRITKLEEIQDNFRSAFQAELQVDDKNIKTPRATTIQKIDTQLSAIVNALKGLTTDQAFVTSGMGVDYNNSFRALRNLVVHGDTRRFSADGVSLTGFLQGLSTATPYANPDDTVRMIAQLQTYGTTQIQLQAEDLIEQSNQATSKWLKSKEGTLNTMLLSNHRALYQALFQQDKTGHVSNEFRFKNPFTDSSLTAEDKEYLKEIIWIKLRLSDTSISEKIRSKSFKELSKNASDLKVFSDKLKNDPNSLNVPLRSASDVRQIGNTLKSLLKGDTTAAKNYWSRKLEKSRNWWDPSGLSDKQLNEKEQKIKTLTAYNMYAESVVDRKKRLAQNGPDAFEQNVNFLINDYIYSYVSVNVNKKILRSTEQAIAALSIMQDFTGRDLSGQIEEIRKRTRISLYNTNNVPADYHDLQHFVGHLRAINNFAKIALRPFLMCKEMTLGRIKNYMYASMHYFENEGITMADMLKADGIVFAEGVFQDKYKKVTGQMSPGERSKVEAINWLYRIANMDANILSEKTIADRYGLMNTGGDMLYYTNTRPDWYNRMAIVVAKMMADGCWDAHKLDDKNHLIYDMSKDKRYSVYAKYRNHPPAKGTSDYGTYMKQKAMYNQALLEFQQLGITKKDGTPLVNGEDLPMAYTPKEVNSLKEVVGMLYGYYNHEEKTSFQTGTYANLFMAFKTYLVGELKHYFALPNGKTSRGKYIHITDGIPTKEHPEGSPLYEKTDEETGLVTYTTDHYNADGSENAAHIGWTATPTEGLLVSFLACGADCFTARGREDLRTNKARRRNAELFLLRMLWGSVIAAVLAMLFVGDDDADETTLAAQYALDIAQKVGNDLSFYHSIIEPVDDMGIVGVDYVTGLFKNTLDVVTNGDKEIQSLILDNVQATKDWLPE